MVQKRGTPFSGRKVLFFKPPCNNRVKTTQGDSNKKGEKASSSLTKIQKRKNVLLKTDFEQGEWDEQGVVFYWSVVTWT